LTAVTETRAVPDTALRRMFELMTRIRRTDDRLQTLLSSGQIRVIYYSPRGQEAIPSAFGAVLRPDDYLLTIYRGLHDHIAKGVALRDLWAEFLGKATGTCKGKGGPMHITDPKSGVMVTTGVVGSGMPNANGLAWSAQVRGTDQVTVVNFGDGASNIGAFHEALNLAAVWKLPAVFVCENNLYMEYTPIRSVTAVEHPAADRARAYGLDPVIVDGNDADAVYRVARASVAKARQGGGPSLIEAKTYRHSGHSRADPGKYRPAGELEEWMKRDPLAFYRKRLLELDFGEGPLRDVERAVQRAVDEATETAKGSPPAPLEVIERDVWDDGGSSWRN